MLILSWALVCLTEMSFICVRVLRNPNRRWGCGCTCMRFTPRLPCAEELHWASFNEARGCGFWPNDGQGDRLVGTCDFFCRGKEDIHPACLKKYFQLLSAPKSRTFPPRLMTTCRGFIPFCRMLTSVHFSQWDISGDHYVGFNIKSIWPPIQAGGIVSSDGPSQCLFFYVYLNLI